MISSTLWAPFLGKDQAVQNATQPAFPPLAPHDKTGTSMRMLIHDIQSGLEQFSARLDGLMTRTEDCRSQVINAKNLLDIEHDRVLTEMADTANRCQSELKLHVGTPAQAHALELVQASQSTTESNIRALEKRIDALQAVSLKLTVLFCALPESSTSYSSRIQAP
ncbi:hypothetical protein ID866_6429 [Astraeus odoratus]|nr:hypothetical protein ID866_6429 [Astraeus odoratus]